MDQTPRTPFQPLGPDDIPPRPPRRKWWHRIVTPYSIIWGMVVVCVIVCGAMLFRADIARVLPSAVDLGIAPRAHIVSAVYANGWVTVRIENRSDEALWTEDLHLQLLDSKGRVIAEKFLGGRDRQLRESIDGIKRSIPPGASREFSVMLAGGGMHPPDEWAVGGPSRGYAKHRAEVESWWARMGVDVERYRDAQNDRGVYAFDYPSHLLPPSADATSALRVRVGND